MAYKVMGGYTFEETGVYLQHTSKTLAQALSRYNYSCERCAFTGRHCDCRCCKIDMAHRSRMAELIDQMNE